MDHVNAHGNRRQADHAANRQVQPVLPAFPGTKGMKQSCLQREYGKDCYDPFDIVQTTALGIIKTNPNITEEDLTNKLNMIVKEEQKENLSEEKINDEKQKSKVKK